MQTVPSLSDFLINGGTEDAQHQPSGPGDGTLGRKPLAWMKHGAHITQADARYCVLSTARYPAIPDTSISHSQ
jgi:hypothetical protein